MANSDAQCSWHRMAQNTDQLRPRPEAISFPEHARSQVKGGYSSGEIELIQAADWLAADSTLDFQRELYASLLRIPT